MGFPSWHSLKAQTRAPCASREDLAKIYELESRNSVIMEVLCSKWGASSKSKSSTPSVHTVSWLHQKMFDVSLFQVHRVGRIHLGRGLNWRCCDEKGKEPMPDPTHLCPPVLFPASGKEALGPMLTMACCTLQLLNACWMPRPFSTQQKCLSQDPALGRRSVKCLPLALSANPVSVLGDSAPFN